MVVGRRSKGLLIEMNESVFKLWKCGVCGQGDDIFGQRDGYVSLSFPFCFFQL